MSDLSSVAGQATDGTVRATAEPFTNIYEWHKVASRAKGLTPTETRVLWHLAAEYANHGTGNGIRPGGKTVAAALGLHASKVWGEKGAIAGLVEKGWLVRTREAVGRSAAHYRLSVGVTVDLPKSARSAQTVDLPDLERRPTRFGSVDLPDLQRQTDQEQIRTSTRAREPERDVQPEPQGVGEDEDFSKFWDMHPKAENRPRTLAAWKKALGTRNGAALLADLASQCAHWAQERKDVKFVPSSALWLENERFLDKVPSVAAPVGTCTPTDEDHRRAQRRGDVKTGHCPDCLAPLTRESAEFLLDPANLPVFMTSPVCEIAHGQPREATA